LKITAHFAKLVCNKNSRRLWSRINKLRNCGNVVKPSSADVNSLNEFFAKIGQVLPPAQLDYNAITASLKNIEQTTFLCEAIPWYEILSMCLRMKR
jgi:hypothetical protein